MGHRTYLIKTSAGRSNELFEANNSIPFFWLTLIDVATVEQAEAEIIEVYNLNEEQSEAYLAQNGYPATLKVSKTRFLKNTLDGAKFIKEHYPSETALYHDFVSYLDLTFDCDDMLELSLIEMANFNDINTLIKSLKDEVSAIKSNRINDINYHHDGSIFYSLTGYDRFLSDQFKNHCVDYRLACEKEDVIKRKNIGASKQAAEREKRSNSYKGFMMLLIGLVLMSACFFIVRKEGVNLTMIASFIFCLTLVVVGYFKIKR